MKVMKEQAVVDGGSVKVAKCVAIKEATRNDGLTRLGERSRGAYVGVSIFLMFLSDCGVRDNMARW